MGQIGGEFKLFDLTLQVVGDNVAPDEISLLLGVEASFASRKGETRRTRGGRELIQPTGVWNITEPGFKGTEVAAAIEVFLGRFPTSAMVWKQIAIMGRVSLTVTIWFAEENGSAMLPPELLTTMSERGIGLLIDVWDKAPHA